MDDNNRIKTDAMDKIIGNMTAEMQNHDGQYVPLGFVPTTTNNPSTTQLNVGLNDQQWNQQENSCHYTNLRHLPIDQQQQGYNFLQQQQQQLLFDTQQQYDVFKSMRQNLHLNSIINHENSSQQNLQTNLIDNLVGNWMVPNNTGTYTPFGNPNESFIPNVFEIQPERHNNNEEIKFVEQIQVDDRQFQFNRENRKPRMVAEVKPMRPSYSDVLTKAPPQEKQTKPIKNDVKEMKPKKDSKKNGKSEKVQKITRSNTNNDIKEIINDKNANPSIKIEKNNNKTTKTSQLSRKWASLDNLTEPLLKNQKTTNEESKKTKKLDEKTSQTKLPNKKMNKTVGDIEDNEHIPTKIEPINLNKNGVKKTSINLVKMNSKRQNDSFNERPPGKRNQRTRKKDNQPFGVFGQKLKQYTKGWWKIFTVFIYWLYNLISDICSLSLHLARDSSLNFWSWLKIHYNTTIETSTNILKSIKLFTWIYEKFKGPKTDEKPETDTNFGHNGLSNNINMPTTGDEAMKRLLACKGKDPYSILGVTPTCTDDDIKRYYKRQAFLVHPDKNQQPGAEEAFKILVHAFDMIGEPERRATYDRGVLESAQVVQAWSELNDLLQKLQQKVEAAANTIRCSACGSKHKRIRIERPCYAARNCNTCKIHHSAREGDIWAEARCFGFRWNYFACMEGAVYDITQWAGCQKENLKHLRPDYHQVQYRIALGKQNNQTRRNMNVNTASSNTRNSNERPDLENLLNTLIGQNDNSTQTTRRKNKKTNK